MHNEDLEGDIQRCWTAMRQTCLEQASNKVPVADVMVALSGVLESTFGSIPEGYEDEAKVASFIAGLFLTHRGFASITQDEVPNGVICIEDAWPQIETFEEVKNLVEDQQAEESERIQSQDLGSVQHAQIRAEKTQRAEEAAARKAQKAAQAVDPVENEQPPVFAPPKTVEAEINEGNAMSEEPFEAHEWLVE